LTRAAATTPTTCAVDGDATSLWIAGQFAPRWIEIDLGAPVTIATIRLGVTQTPREGEAAALAPTDAERTFLGLGGRGSRNVP
jgi:hypothetical protein